MRLSSLPILSALLTLAAPAAASTNVVGDWLAPGGGAEAHLSPCGDDLCGVVTWLRHPLNPTTGQIQTDARNPDPALRTRPILGMKFLSGFKAAGESRWTGGRIYDPTSGRTYQAKLSLQGNGQLKVEGCVGPFCKAQYWTPA